MQLIDKRTFPHDDMVNYTIRAVQSLRNLLIPLTGLGESLSCTALMVSGAEYDYSQVGYDNDGAYHKKGSNRTPYTMIARTHQSVYNDASTIRYLANQLNCSGGWNYGAGATHFADLRYMGPERLYHGTWSPQKAIAYGQHQYGLDPTHPLYPDPATPVIYDPCLNDHVPGGSHWYHVTSPDTEAIPDMNADGSVYPMIGSPAVPGNKVTAANWAGHAEPYYDEHGNLLGYKYDDPSSVGGMSGPGWTNSPTNQEFCLFQQAPAGIGLAGSPSNFVGADPPDEPFGFQYLESTFRAHVNIRPTLVVMPTWFKHAPVGTTVEGAKIRLRFNGLQMITWDSSRHWDGSAWVVDTSNYSTTPVPTGLVMLGYYIDPDTGMSTWESLGFSFSDENGTLETDKWITLDASTFVGQLLSPSARKYRGFTVVPAFGSGFLEAGDLKSTLRGLMPVVSYAHWQEEPYPPMPPGWENPERPWGNEGSAEVSNSGWWIEWSSVEISHVALYGISYPETELNKAIQIDGLPPMH